MPNRRQTSMSPNDDAPDARTNATDGESIPAELLSVMRRDLRASTRSPICSDAAACRSSFWRRRWSSTGQVAIKVLPLQLFDGADAAERFEREGKISASLDHPHIVPIFRVGATSTFLWYTMKRIRGRFARADHRRARRPAPRGCAQHRPAGGRCAAVRAPSRRRASRREAGQRDDRGIGLGIRLRLRCRARVRQRLAHPRPARRSAHRATCLPSRSREAGGRPLRSVLPRHPGVGGADRCAPIHRRIGRRADPQTPARAGAATQPPRATTSRAAFRTPWPAR